MLRSLCSKWLKSFAICTIFTTWAIPCKADIQADGTAGTQVNSDDKNQVHQILDGTQIDQNLLHSFLEFSVAEGWTAQFLLTNHTDINNIIARITGSDVSNINGVLSVENIGHPVSLFLINPHGILIGPNARLDLNGSFIASTAESIQFSSGYRFSTKQANSPPILTLGVPIGLQFGANPAPITGQFTQPLSSFGVQEGQTLALVGGDVALQGPGPLGGSILASNGQIDIGSVGAGEIVGLTAPTQQRGWSLDFSNVRNFQDLSISNTLIIDGTDSDIFLYGRQIRISDSFVQGEISLESKRSLVSINASDLLEVSNVGISGFQDASAPGGNIQIQAQKLRLLEGSFISTSASGSSPNSGPAGNIMIQAEQIDLNDSFISSSAFDQAEKGGKISISTNSLSLENSSSIRGVSMGVGNAGSIDIFTRSILLDQGSSIVATSTSSGNGGDINLIVQDALILRNQSNISTSNTGSGNGGDINILAGLIAAVPNEDSNISTDAVLGNGGNIKITTQGLFGIYPNTANSPNSSDITASSKFGLNGTIDTSIVSTTPVTDLAALPTVLNQKILKTACFGTRSGSNRDSFVYSGRGGLPTTPSDPDQNMAVWQDFRAITHLISQGEKSTAPLPSKAQTIAPSAPPIIEAQGFSFGPDGSVHLVATASVSSPQSQVCAATKAINPTAQPSSVSALGR
jgi:filamentous hemagglutinin family protein